MKKNQDVKRRACVNFDRNSWTSAARGPLRNQSKNTLSGLGLGEKSSGSFKFIKCSPIPWEDQTRSLILRWDLPWGLDGESSYQAGLSCYPLILRSSHDLLSHFLTVLPQKWKKYIVTENSRQILLRNLYTSFDR